MYAGSRTVRPVNKRREAGGKRCAHTGTDHQAAIGARGNGGPSRGERMYISRITVKNYLLFESIDVALAEGLNVILAPNEGGKSSLMRAVITGLYGDAASRSKDVRSTRLWGSGSLPRVELWIRLGSKDLRIVRDFGARKQYIYLGGSPDHFRGGRDVERFLRDELVIPDENLFVRVCAVRQEELARVADGRLKLGDSLEEILSGGWGSASPAQVEQVLEEMRAELQRGLDRPAKRENWGPLKLHTHEMTRLERELADALTVEKRRAILLGKLSEARHERERIGLGLLEERKERAAEYAALKRRAEEAEGRMRNIQQRKERLEKLIDMRDNLTAKGNEFPRNLHGRDEGALDAIRRDIEREDILEREIDKARERAKAPPSPVWLIAGVLLVAAGIVGWVLGGAAFAPVAVIGVAVFAWALAERRRRRGGDEREGFRGELDLVRRRRREWSGDRSLDESREALRAFHAWRGELHETNARLAEAVREYGGIRRADSDAIRTETAVSGEKGNAGAILDSLGAEFVRLSAVWHALREKLDETEPFHLEAGGLLCLDEEINRTETEARGLDEDISSLERELLGLPEQKVNLLREQLAITREALERANQKAALVDTLLEVLVEARSRVAGFLAEKLPPLAERYLSAVTNDRYGKVYIDPVTVHVEIRPAADDILSGGDPGHTPERVSPEELSQGARDQIYFAVRLSIVELLGGRDPQPLLLDDPFVHFDAERRARALDLLKEFSRRHQVLLFSCDSRFERIGGSVIRL